MRTKTIICPERERRVPRQFSWIDHRLVSDRHIQGPSPQALSLYLFLCTVADSRGLSYYSDASAGHLLTLEPVQVRDARRELMKAGLIAYRSPLYQVLSLEPLPPPPPPPREPLAAQGRPASARSVGEILHAMIKKEGSR
jgi:hypothetical protein